MTRAIVTGGNGFLGAALLRTAAALGIDAVGVRRPDCDYAPGTLAALIDRESPALVVHAAGPASVAASQSDPHADFEASAGLFERVLEGVRRSGRRPRVVYLSSAAVYGNPRVLPVREDAPLEPLSPYGHHKLLCEQLSREYAACFGIPGTVARIFSLFGEQQQRLILWELFRQHREAAEVRLMGTGDEERDYLQVDDCAGLVWRCARASGEAHLVLNVARGESIRVIDLARRIGEALGRPRPIVAEGRRNPGDPAVWRADVSRLRALLGDVEVPSFEQRLRAVLEAWSG